MTRKAVIAILVDALRYDYVNREDSPLLYRFKEQGISGELIGPFGFRVLPAIFGGLYPQESGIGYLWHLDPGTSPCRFMENIGLGGMVNTGVQNSSVIRDAISSGIREIERCAGNSASSHYADCGQIPFDLLPLFTPSEKRLIWERACLPRATLFDVLNERGENWLYIGYPVDNQYTERIVNALRQKLSVNHRFIFVHFGELDWAGHIHGPGSPIRQRVLRDIDRAIGEIARMAEQMFEDVAWVIFGDHGMVEVRRTIDVAGFLAGIQLRVPEDYIYFLDSTQARFWFSGDTARSMVQEVLSKIDGGRLLNEYDLRRLKMEYSDNRNGELYFAADENVMILPNFFQGSEPARGMHGYLPEVKDNWAALILVNNSKKLRLAQPVEMTDLYPTLLALLRDSDSVKHLQSMELKEALEEGSRLGSVSAQFSDPLLDDREFVSVIIPTFDRREILQRTLDGFLEQTYPRDKYEVIVVDDGSTDGTHQLVQGYLQGRSNIRYFIEENKGPSAARNLGAKRAAGSILLFTGDDCIPDQSLVARHSAAHRDIRNLALVGYTAWHPDLKISPVMHHVTKGAQFAYSEIEDADEISFRYVYTSNFSVRKETLETAGWFDEDFRDAAFEDIELGYRLSKMGVRIVYDRNAVTYHYHPTDLNSFARRQQKAGRAAVKAFLKHPELKDDLGIGRIADPEAREQAYNGVLNYAYMVGVEEGLRGCRDTQAVLPVEGLRSNFEEWIDAWAIGFLQKLQRMDEEARGIIRDKDEVIVGLERSLAETNEYLKTVIRDKDELIAGLERSLAETNKYLEIVIRDKDKLITGLERSLAETNEYLKTVIRDKDEVIAGLQSELEKSQAVIAHLQNILPMKVYLRAKNFFGGQIRGG